MYNSKIEEKSGGSQARACIYNCETSCYMGCDDNCAVSCTVNCEIFNGTTAIDPKVE